MKNIIIFFILLLSLSVSAQNQTSNDYQNIQGKWICTTPKYKNHSFWVKGMSFFQKYRKGTLEQALPYEIKNFNYEDHEINIIGLFVKCIDCYNDVWTIQELTDSKLVLVNYDTEEIAEYKKATIKSKK